MALTIPSSFAGTPASIKSQAEALLAKATTQAEVDKILVAARGSNAKLDQNLVSQVKLKIADATKQAAATAKAAADKAAADKAAADKAAAAAAAAKAATAPGTPQYAANKLGLSLADYTAAVNNLIATNPTYKNRDVATISSMVGAKTGDPSALITTSAKTVAANIAADKAAQAAGYANAKAQKEAENAAAAAAQQKQKVTDTLNAQVKSVKNIDELINTLQAAKNQGITLDSAAVTAASKTATQNVKTLDDIQAFNDKAKAAGITVPTEVINTIANSAVANVKSFDELKALDSRVKGLGGTLAQNTVDSAVDTISKASGATTREGLAALQQQASAAGFKPSQSYIDQQMATIAKAEADAAAKAEADAQALKTGFANDAAKQKFITANQVNIDWAKNNLIKKGMSAADAAATVDDVVKNYNDSNKFVQALESAVYSPESYERYKQINIPTKALEATKALNDQLYDTKTGWPKQLTQDQLDKIVADAKEQGLPIQQSYVTNVQNQIDRTAKDAAFKVPDTSTISTVGSQPSYATLPSGLKLFGLPDDPKTGQKAGWYVDTGAGYQKWDQGAQGSVIPYNEFGQQAQTVFGNIQQQSIDKQMSDWYKTVSAPDWAESKNYESIFENIDLTAPDGSKWLYKPADRATGTGAGWFTMTPGSQGAEWKPATITAEGAKISDTPVSRDVVQQQLSQLQTANNQTLTAENAAKQAAYDAAHPYHSYAQDDGFELDFLGKLSLVTLIAVAAAPYISSLFSGATEGVAALTEGAEAAAGLAEAGMSGAEVAATLEASGVPTAVADVMAESAIAATTGAVDVGAALASSGISAETLAMANATLDPIAALTAAQGWTAVDMAYIASIGVPASVLATAEATNIAMGLPASEIGTAATAEVAGTVPPGTAAEVAASQPVVPPGAETVAAGPAAPAVDTSQMIPTVDAAGNPGFFDPATGNTLNAAGEVVAEAAMPAVGEGTQLASAFTPAQEAQYDLLISQGYSPAQAAEAIGAAGEVAAIPEIVITAGSTAPVITAEEAILGAAGLGGLGAIAAGGGGAAAPVAATPPAAPSPAAPSAPSVPTPAQPAEVPVTEATPTPVEPTTPVQPAQPTAPVETPVATQPTAPVEPGPYAPPTTTAPTELATPATSGQPTIPGTETQAPVYDAGPTSLPSTEVVPPPPVTPQYPVDVPTTPVDPGNPYAPDNIDVGGGWNPAEVPVTDAVPVPAPGTGLPGTIPTGGLGLKDLANLYAGSQLLGALLVPKIPEIKRRTYAPIGPVKFGDVGRVDLPGTNPGQFVGVPAQYQTNNMQQSKFYWGQHPYQTGAEFSPEQYRQVAAPVTPWGLQQMYNPQTETINNLLAGVQQASTQAPYNVPRAPLI